MTTPLAGLLLKMFIFACVGVTMEVVFTALGDLPKTKTLRLMGYTYIWMLPIYALVPIFLMFLTPRLAGIILPFRIVIYTILLMIVEYISGWILRKTVGACPWEAGYQGKRWAVHGLVRLDYAPVWALVCLIFERLYHTLWYL